VLLRLVVVGIGGTLEDESTQHVKTPCVKKVNLLQTKLMRNHIIPQLHDWQSKQCAKKNDECR
jgi:hypothetical protein